MHRYTAQAMKPLLLLPALALLAACAAPPEQPAAHTLPSDKPAACAPAYALDLFFDQHGAQACNCGPAYQMELVMPYLIYERLAPITGEETVNGQRRTPAAQLTCALIAQGDDSITHECLGTNLGTEAPIKATAAQARALIDALHLARVPEDRTDAGVIRYPLTRIQCVYDQGCTAMVGPPCLM